VRLNDASREIRHCLWFFGMKICIHVTTDDNFRFGFIKIIYNIRIAQNLQWVLCKWLKHICCKTYISVAQHSRQLK
jgi:hypothetical protein